VPILLLVPGLLLGCDSSTNSDTNDPSTDSWDVVMHDLDGTLLSVYAPSSDNVWAVGSNPGDGLGGYAFHFDGETWERLDTGDAGIIWWAAGDDAGHVWLVGDGGLILRWSPDSGFETFDTPGVATLFSIFALEPDNVWACGVAHDGLRSEVAIWHFDGDEWSEDPDEPGALIPGKTPNKIWGRSSEDLWIVGGTDVGLHRSENGWKTVDVGTQTYLTTIHGNDHRVVAVGGPGRGGLVDNDGSGFTEVLSATEVPNLAGVALHPDDRGIAVGWWDTVVERVDGEWARLDDIPDLRIDYHGVAITPDGEIWAAGGLFNSIPLREGALIRGQLQPE
jgi:hypothetical protein